jgi:hypothetical protein
MGPSHPRQEPVERVLVLDVTGSTFSRAELVDAFAVFEQTVERAAQTRDWDPWVDQYTDDVVYVVYDEATGRVLCELDNPMRDPGDGTIISATNISIITYAGDGKWLRQEDVYNPLRFVSAAMKWCRKARELGTLPDEAQAWMQQMGGQK